MTYVGEIHEPLRYLLDILDDDGLCPAAELGLRFAADPTLSIPDEGVADLAKAPVTVRRPPPPLPWWPPPEILVCCR